MIFFDKRFSLKIFVTSLLLVNLLASVHSVLALPGDAGSTNRSCENISSQGFKRLEGFVPIVDDDVVLVPVRKLISLPLVKTVEKRAGYLALALKETSWWKGVDFWEVLHEINTFFDQLEDIGFPIENEVDKDLSEDYHKSLSSTATHIADALACLLRHADSSDPDSFVLDMSPQDIYCEVTKLLRRLYLYPLQTEGLRCLVDDYCFALCFQ